MENNGIKYIDLAGGCTRWKMGRTNLYKLAKESGAMLKIGKSVRIDVQAFEQYISDKYAVHAG